MDKKSLEKTRKHKQTVWIVTGLCVACFAAGVSVPLLMDAHKSDDLAKVENIYGLLKDRWFYGNQVEDLDSRLAEQAIAGMTTLEEDPHTNYFNLEEAKAFSQSLAGSNVGVGISFYRNADDEMTVRDVFLDSTADKAGLRTGDVLVKVGTKETKGLPNEEITQTIQNYEGQKLPVEVRRGDELLTLTLEPGEYDSTVVCETVDGIGIIDLSSFSENSGREFASAVKKLESQGVRNVIIDLRGNTGGYLSAAKDISEVLLPKDSVIFQEKDKDGNIRKLRTEQEGQADFDRIVILQDGSSASASEVLIGALKDNLDNVTTVGTQTYGKGTEQVSVPFTDGTSLKYTIAEWLTPSGESINRTGFAPDVEVGLSPVRTVTYPGMEEGEVIVPDSVNELADDILCELRKAGISVSDRKYLNYYPIAQAKAWLSGHSQVESQDLLALKNYLWQKPGDRPGVETVLERMCVNPMQDKVNGIRAMAVDVRTEFDAAISDASKPNAGSKALIKLRGELVRLYNEQQKLAASVQSDGEKALTDGLLADMEQINRKAHEAVGFTYTPLEQLAALQ